MGLKSARTRGLGLCGFIGEVALETLHIKDWVEKNKKIERIVNKLITTFNRLQ